MSRTATGPVRRKNSETLASNEGMAEELKSFFSSIFTRTELVCQEQKIGEQRRREESASGRPKVRTKIRKLRAAAAAGPGGIGPGVLQDLENEIIDCLALVFSESF